MKERYYVLKDEISKIEARRLELLDKYRQEAQRKAEACEQSSETWHDNFEFEDARRNLTTISNQIQEVEKILSNIEVVSQEDVLKSPHDTITIGKKVAFLLDGREDVLIVGGYQSAVNGRCPYNAPLVKGMLGKSIGDIVDLVISGKKRNIEILEVDPITI